MHGNEEINKNRIHRHLVSLTKLYIFSDLFFQNFQKQNWESKSVLFNDPSVPVIYPTSGLRVEPDEVLKVPIKITKVSAVLILLT